jgi:uncharacterized protein
VLRPWQIGDAKPPPPRAAIIAGGGGGVWPGCGLGGATAFVYLSWYNRGMSEELGNLIEQARIEAGLTQARLAALAGTSQPAVARYEGGTVTPTIATASRLLAACGRRLSVTMTPSEDNADDLHPTPDLSFLRRRRAALLKLATAHGAGNVRVFGSLSRGEQHPASDVDLLVDLDSGRTLLDLASFRDEVSRLLGVPVHVATQDMLKDRARVNALAEAIPL